MKAYLEHANLTVSEPKKTVEFLLSAFPEWRIRGQNTMDWFGKTVEWFHVGSDDSYISIQGGGEEPIGQWQGYWSGVKHLGFVVEDLEATIERLAEAGFEVDHPGGEHPYRKTVYYIDGNNVQIELVQYFSELAEQRNDYVL